MEGQGDRRDRDGVTGERDRVIGEMDRVTVGRDRVTGMMKACFRHSSMSQLCHICEHLLALGNGTSTLFQAKWNR